MTQAKNQHYVPQLLLKNFASEKGQLWVFDKKHRRSFKENKKNVASQNYFYNTAVNDGSFSMEEWLSQIETIAAPTINTIVSQRNLEAINSATKRDLAFFFAVQMVRTTMPQGKLKRLIKTLRETYISQGKSIEELDEHLKEFVTDPTEDDLKAHTARSILENAPIYAPYLENKVWALLACSTNEPYLIGDHPVTRKNEINKDSSDYPGITKLGIEIYIPLSTDLCLALWCPSVIHGMNTQFAPESNWTLDQTFKISDLLIGSKYASKLINILQIYWSERFLLSKSGDFGDLESQLEKLPFLRSGPRPGLGVQNEESL